MVAIVTGSSKQIVPTEFVGSQLVIGHVAQASWHLQHALSYCPTTSINLREITSIVTMFTDMLSSSSLKIWPYVPAYLQDDSSICHYGDELFFALWHLRRAEYDGSRAKVRSWPVSHQRLDAVISKLERLMRSVTSPVSTSVKEHESRIKKRTSRPQEPKVINTVRKADQRRRLAREAAKQPDLQAEDEVAVRGLLETSGPTPELLP